MDRIFLLLFAGDLHDVLGTALAPIAVGVHSKSEIHAAHCPMIRKLLAGRGS